MYCWTFLKKTNKLVSAVIIVSFLMIALTSCANSSSNHGQSGKQGIDFSDALVVDPLKGPGGYAIAFTGGTGWHDEPTRHYYEYSGGEMDVEFEIGGCANPWEFGLGIVLDGVCQNVKLITETGESELKPVHRFKVSSGEVKSLRFRFTPNVGKAGDVLNIGVLTIDVPSSTAPYSGSKTHPFAFVQKAQGASMMAVKFDVDAPRNLIAFEPRITRTEVPDEYLAAMEKRLANIQDPDTRESERNEYVKMSLFSDPPGASSGPFDNEPYLLAKDSDVLNACFEVFGKPQEYRITIFIDHEPVELSQGQTFFEISSDRGSLARAELEIPLNGITETSVIYALISEHVSETEWDDFPMDFWSQSTYMCNYSTWVKYLFVGNVPEPMESPESLSTATTEPVATINPLEIETGAMLDFRKQGYTPAYMSETSDGKLVVVEGAPERGCVTVYDLEGDKIEKVFNLPEHTMLTYLSNGKLITVQNPGYDESEVNIFDLSGDRVARFPLTGALELSAADRERLINHYQSTIFDRLNPSLMISNDGALLLYAECSSIENDSISFGNVYLVDLVTGDRSIVGLELENIRGVPVFFDGGRIAMTGQDLKENATFVELYSVSGDKLNSWSIPANVDGSFKQICSASGSLLLLSDQVAQGSSASPSGKLAILNLDTADIVDFEVLAKDSEWAKLSSDGELVLTICGSEDLAQMRLYDLKTGNLIRGFAIENVLRPWFESIALVDVLHNKVLVQNAARNEYGSLEYVITSIAY